VSDLIFIDPIDWEWRTSENRLFSLTSKVILSTAKSRVLELWCDLGEAENARNENCNERINT